MRPSGANVRIDLKNSITPLMAGGPFVAAIV